MLKTRFENKRKPLLSFNKFIQSLNQRMRENVIKPPGFSILPSPIPNSQDILYYFLS